MEREPLGSCDHGVKAWPSAACGRSLVSLPDASLMNALITAELDTVNNEGDTMINRGDQD